MKKRKLLKITAYWLLAAALTAVLFLLTYTDRAQKLRDRYFWIPPSDARIVVLGDSIMGIVRDETSVTQKLSSYLGEPVFNGALGGTCLSRLDLEKRTGYGKDALSMAGLARAIAGRDFGVQQTLRIRESATEYFADTIDEMEKMDFSRVEILFIEHGLNDYHGGAILAGEDPLDEYTFTGALRSSITILQKAYPDLRIILVTPTYAWYTGMGVTCEEYDAGYGTLEAFVEAEKEVAREFGLETVDLYHDFYPHESWEDMYLFTEDGLHPNEAGRELIARKLADYLRETGTGRKETET